MTANEDNNSSKVFLQFKDLIQSYQETNGGVKEPDLTEPRLDSLENLQVMKNNRIIEKDKLRDNTKGGWHIGNLVNFGENI